MSDTIRIPEKNVLYALELDVLDMLNASEAPIELCEMALRRALWEVMNQRRGGDPRAATQSLTDWVLSLVSIESKGGMTDGIAPPRH